MRQQQSARRRDQARIMKCGDAAVHLNTCGTRCAHFPLALLTFAAWMRIARGRCRGPTGARPTLQTRKKRARSRRSYRLAIRSVGGDARAAGQQWGRSTVWTLRMLPLLVAAIWRLLLHGLVVLLCFLAVSMAAAGGWGSLGAMETTVRGCSQRQERSAELLRFGLIWDALTDRSAAWCAHVWR